MESHPEQSTFHPDQVKLAKSFSAVWVMGPPMSGELLELVAHLFSPEEAGLARTMTICIPRSPRAISRKAGVPVGKAEPMLEAMAAKRVIVRTKKGNYVLLPLIPGMFEYLLMTGADSPWHRRYGQLINSLFATGYVKTYTSTRIPAIRNIPVETAVEHKSRIVGADLMSRMIDAHDTMGVLNVCQCRQSHAFSGDPCRRSAPEDGCLLFGSFAETIEEDGTGRKVSRDEMRAIVRERWEKNLVFMSANLEPELPNAICTCCDCCCHYVEAINDYGGRISLADPHFLVRVDEASCTGCGKCVPVCNTRAHEVADRKHRMLSHKCIGCGLCVDVCPKKVITLEENPRYREPSGSWLSLWARILPAGIAAACRARFRR